MSDEEHQKQEFDWWSFALKCPELTRAVQRKLEGFGLGGCVVAASSTTDGRKWAVDMAAPHDLPAVVVLVFDSRPTPDEAAAALFMEYARRMAEKRGRP